MMWCVGYLNRSQLKTFLQKAKTRLITSGGPKRRRQLPASFIFVFDNVAKEGEVFEPIVEDEVPAVDGAAATRRDSRSPTAAP